MLIEIETGREGEFIHHFNLGLTSHLTKVVADDKRMERYRRVIQFLNEFNYPTIR